MLEIWYLVFASVQTISEYKMEARIITILKRERFRIHYIELFYFLYPFPIIPLETSTEEKSIKKTIDSNTIDYLFLRKELARPKHEDCP